MPDLFTYILFFIGFFILELIYFRIAVNYKIIDKPNERSSHKRMTVRGGGIIFPAAVLCWFFLNDFQYPFFVSGLLLVSVISFIDDILDLHSRVRFIAQFAAVACMFWQLPLGLAWYDYLLAFIMIIGTINAWNFMDGINGITGIYSIVVLFSLYRINQTVQFTDETLLILLFIALLVFGFFNFRKKAVCFAGDIGSVAIAFSICFLLLQLIVKTGNLLYILFLLVYGLDSVITILFRLRRRENIFEAHRTHFYQYLSNEQQWPHLWVSVLYGSLQLAINLLLITFIPQNTADSFLWVIVISLVTGILFITLRFRVESRKRLLGN